MNHDLSGKTDSQPRRGSANAPEGRSSDAWEARGLGLVVYGLQSPVNIGMILRIAEAYQFQVAIFDSHGVLDDPEKRATMSDFACGALSRRAFHRLEDPAALVPLRRGRRLVATALGRQAQPLPDFRFLPGDLIAFGNEYDGLPDEFVAGADVLLQVPAPAIWMPKEKAHSPIDPFRTAPVPRDGQPSLNVAVAAGVVCYAAYAGWLGRPGGAGMPREAGGRPDPSGPEE